MGRVNRQETAVAVAAGANKWAAILMGTVMAVYVGREGSAFAVNMVTATFYFGLTVFSPLWGAVADVLGRRRLVLVLSAALAALAVLPLTVVDGVVGPLAFRTLFAVFAAGFLPVALAIVSERGGDDGRGRAIGVFSSGAAVGFMLGQLLSGVLVDALDRSTGYLVIAAVAGAVAVVCLVVEDPGGGRATGGRVTPRRLWRETIRRVVPTTGTAHLRRNGLHWLFVASFLRNSTVLGLSSLLPVYLVTDVGVSPFVMGVVLAVNPAVQILGMYGMGRLSDRVGRRTLVLFGLAGSGLHSTVLALAVLPGSVRVRALVAAAGLFTLGISFSALQTGVVAFIGDVAPDGRESELIGLRSTARGLGGMVAPPLIGLAANALGFEPVFLLVSLLSWIGLGLVAAFVTESHDPRAAVSGTAS